VAGRPGRGVALAVDIGTHEYDRVAVPEDLGVVVYHTGVADELVNSEYNDRRATVEAARDALGVDSVAGVEAGDLAELPDKQRQRLGYVVREDERVRRATAALEAGDFGTVGALLRAARRDIATAYEASRAELDFLVETAVDAGAYGARFTGAGWGGAAIALVDGAAADDIARSVHDTNRERYPDHDSRYHLVTQADGVTVERTEA